MKRTRILLCALGLMSLTGLPSFGASVETKGFLKYELWFSPIRGGASLEGTDVAILYNDPNFPATPDAVSYAAGMNSRTVFPDDTHEQYGSRMSGWITPEVDGNYNFYLASDDASQLWISTDATEANLQMVAEEATCCHGFMEVGSAQTTMAAIAMKAGQKYAVQVLLKEGGGGDFVQVAWQLEGGTTPATKLTPLKGMMLSSMADPAGASVNITQQPANATIAENSSTPVTFTIAATAVTPFGKYTAGGTPTQGGTVAAAIGTKAQLDTFYQWFTNNVEVPGANGTNVSFIWPKMVQNGMKVKCYVAVPGVSVTSSEATLTVTPDVTAPTVLKVSADFSFTKATVKFSEPVTDSALAAARYSIDQGITVSSVARVDDSTVRLTTSKMVENATYTITVNGVQDTAATANTIAANTKVQFKTLVFVPNVVLHQKFKGFSDGVGQDPENLFADPRFRDTPDRAELMTRYEYPANAAGRDETLDPSGAANRNYFDTLEAWFVPPANGDYVFFMAFADRCWVYLSTDEDPANKLMVMGTTGWSDPRSWLASHDYDPLNSRTDLSPNNKYPTTPKITLQAGKRYYMLAVHHDTSWAGGDWFAATYKKEADPDPANGSAPTLVGNAVGVFLDPSLGTVSFTLQPQSKSVLAGNKVTLSAAATGSSPYTTNVLYQWQSAPKGSSTFADIPGATSANYTTDFLTGADDGKQFRVIATVAPASAISSVATLSVTVDTIPPTVAKASTDMNWNNVVITFSEPVSDTALQVSNYSFDQGVTISSITRIDSVSVKLTTSTLAEGKTYSLTITGVKDMANNTIAANTVQPVRTLVFVAGAALRQKYTNFDNGLGGNPQSLFSDPRYPNNADRQDIVTRWEYPPNGAGRIDAEVPPKNFFDYVEGYFIPATTGDYVFYTAGADRFWLYLSTDESPANKKLITAQANGWTNPRAWNTPMGTTDITLMRSDTYANTEWPQGATIHLEAGKRYYMMEMHHTPSWAGADDFAATFTLVGEPAPKDGDAPKLTGNLIGYYFNPAGASLTFVQQPQNTSAIQGQMATLTVAATGTSMYGSNVLYQWQSAPKGSSTWTDIAGATGSTYRTPVLGLANDGTQYRVVASVVPYTQTSAAVTLTVAPDTTPPSVTVGAMQGDTAGVMNVGVGFDETVDDASGKLLANYSVSPGAITEITWQTNFYTAHSQNPLAMIKKQTALLKVTGLSGSGTLTVKNVQDLYGNKITSVSVPFTVDTKMKWGVVGGNEFGGWNAVVPVTPNGWDVYSDAMTSYANYDEATFVYEQVTGDFDKKVRVAYQDGSSQWARAALIAKEATGFGVDRATQATTAARYQKVLVYPVGPVLQGPGTPGASRWDTNRRLDVGGATTGAAIAGGANGVPQYPNAWLRLQRVGQKFSLYRSDDGVNWTLLGSTTWGVDDTAKSPMPATLFVGLDFSPELGNIADVTDRGTFLAQFRDYGDYTAEFNPQVRIGADATGKVTITWTTGTLVSSPSLTGNTWTPVQGAASPYTLTPAGTMFYRVQQ